MCLRVAGYEYLEHNEQGRDSDICRDVKSSAVSFMLVSYYVSLCIFLAGFSRRWAPPHAKEILNYSYCVTNLNVSEWLLRSVFYD